MSISKFAYLALVFPLIAAAGTGTFGGGDLDKADEVILTEYLLSGKFNQVVHDCASNIVSGEFTDPSASKLWNTLIAEGLLEDIARSRYVPEASCGFGSDPNAAASTLIPEGGTPIPNSADVCFDVNQLVQNKASYATLLALAIHESVHHFGYGEPEAYLITQAVGAQILEMDHVKAAPISDVLALDPNAEPLVSQLTAGTKFHIIQDLSAYDTTVIQKGQILDAGIFSAEMGIVGDAYCRLQKPLRSGETYNVSYAEQLWGPTQRSAYRVGIGVEDDSMLSFICYQSDGLASPLTFRELAEILNGVIAIDPVFLDDARQVRSIN